MWNLFRRKENEVLLKIPIGLIYKSGDEKRAVISQMIPASQIPESGILELAVPSLGGPTIIRATVLEKVSRLNPNPLVIVSCSKAEPALVETFNRYSPMEILARMGWRDENQ